MTDMANAKTKTATYADIEALPPNVVGEILFGSLVTHPRPVPDHLAAVDYLGYELGPPFSLGRGGPGGWIILSEPELHLGPHVVVPDLAGWRNERLAGREKRAWFDVAPDWICEVLSPSTRSYDLGPKRRIYATYAVSHLWHVDPSSKSLEVFLRQDASWLLTHTFVGYEDVSAPPFDAITFSLGILWPFDPAADDNPKEA
jgi:Uma2 family endonuclease